jgi:hypothetical protein
MTKVIVDPATAATLHGLNGSAELCDESGHTIGYFHPAVDPSLYEQVQVPFSEEELQAAEQEAESYTTAEVLDNLENLS